MLYEIEFGRVKNIGKNILIVDDDSAVRKLITIMLKSIRPNDKISSVETVKEALNHLSTEHCDIIISDYNLPDGTGKTIFSNSNPDILKIGISGMQKLADFEQTTNLFLRKPFGLADLTSIFNQVPND